MRIVIFILLLFPFFVYGQQNLRANFSLEQNLLNSFYYRPENIDTGENFYSSIYAQATFKSGSGISSSFSLEYELNKNWSFHSGLSFSGQSFVLETGRDYNADCSLIDKLVIRPTNLEVVPEIRHHINFSNFGVFSGFSIRESFGKFGVQTGLFIGGEYLLSFETKSTSIDEFSNNYSEEITIQGDSQPNKLYAYGKLTTGIFYNLTPVLRISGTPFFSLNFNKAKASHLNHQFYKFGVALGLSYQVK